MFSRRVRIVVVLACAFLAVRTALQDLWILAALFLVAAVVFTLGYWRNGPVWLASRYLRAGRGPKARALLNEVRNPERLVAPQPACYYYLSGMLDLRDQDYGSAAVNFAHAARGPWRLPRDSVAMCVNTAEASLSDGQLDKCASWLERAKSQPAAHDLANHISDIESRLALERRGIARR